MMFMECIRLKNAMNKGIDHVVRTWNVSGCHIQTEAIPAGAAVDMTFVLKSSTSPYQLGVIWTIESKSHSYQRIFGEFSTLEEMQSKYPHLFELVGTLYAFP